MSRYSYLNLFYCKIDKFATETSKKYFSGGLMCASFAGKGKIRSWALKRKIVKFVCQVKQ